MRKRYSNDFKVMLVELLHSGMKVKDLSSEYDVDGSCLRRWRIEYDKKGGDFSKKRELSIQEKELKKIKKELREVTLERDILKKAVSIFSKSDR